jgi:hypothetical protein
MADRARKGDQEIRIVDPTTQDAAEVLDVSGVKRLAVISQIDGDVTVAFGAKLIANRVHEFDTATIAAHPHTILEYTVPVDKVFEIMGWHLQTEKATTKVELQVDGVAIDTLRFDTSTDTRRIDIRYPTESPLYAEAGEVVRVRTISGQTSKEYIAGFFGYIRDAV